MEATAKPIGEILPAVVDREGQPQTDLLQQSTIELRSLDLAALPARLDDTMLAKMRELAVAPIPPLKSFDEGVFFEKIAVLQANLPHRAADEVSGAVRAETYWRVLGGRPAIAIEHMVAAALKRCQWFPTIRECEALLDEWVRNDGWSRKRAAVGQIVEREVRLRFEGVMDALERRAMSQAEIDALPRRYKLIAVERGTLRALNDGSYVAWPDASMMGEDELQAHRERVQQLIADGLL